MSRRYRSSQPTPTPMNGKVTKSARYVKTKKERTEGLAVRDRNTSSTKAIAIPPAKGVGREGVYGKAKSYQKSSSAITAASLFLFLAAQTRKLSLSEYLGWTEGSIPKTPRAGQRW